MLNTSFDFVDTTSAQTLLITASRRSGKTRLARALVANHVERGDTVIWIEFYSSANFQFREWLTYFTADKSNAVAAKETLVNSRLLIYDLVDNSFDAIEQTVQSVLSRNKQHQKVVLVVDEADRLMIAPLLDYVHQRGYNLVATYKTDGDVRITGAAPFDQGFNCVLNIQNYSTVNDVASIHVIRQKSPKEAEQTSVVYTLDAQSGLIIDRTTGV